MRDNFPELFNAVIEHFDKGFAEHYEELATSGILIPAFVRSHKMHLSNFMCLDDISGVVDSIEKGEQPKPELLRAVLATSRVAKTMLAEQALKCSFDMFVLLISDWVKHLEHHDYDLTEVDSFKKLMRRESLAIEEAGIATWEKKVLCCNFLTVVARVQITDLDDEWQYRFSAEVKTAAISNGSVPQTPWEAVLWPEVQVQGVRQSVKVPEELLGDIRNVRGAINQLFSGYAVDQLTFSEMKKIINPHIKALCALERTVIIDIVVLLDNADLLGNHFVFDIFAGFEVVLALTTDLD